MLEAGVSRRVVDPPKLDLPMRKLIPLGLLMVCALALHAAPVFQDGFETGTLSPEWMTDTTNSGRHTLATQYAPATGLRHLVLDDSLSDAVFSVSEATLRLDLTNKRNVVLSFKAKSLGNEPHMPPAANFSGTRSFDGVSISADGGVTWRTVQSLATLGTAWESFSVVLDSAVSALGATYGDSFRIRFSEYDNAPAPLDGIAIDDVAVTADEDQRALLELPSPLMEGSAGHTGYVLLAFAPATPLTLDLSASPAGQLNIPATVTVLAGETFASFSFSVLDDSLVNLTRTATVNATAAGVISTPGTFTILDDDAPIATLALPAQLAEGAVPSNNATISLDRIPSVAVTITLSATPAAEITIPATVTIPAGQTQVSFTVRAVNDTKIDGDVSVTVTAGGSAIAAVAAQTTTVDNETRALTLILPATVQEAGTATGTARISGTLPAALTVSLTGTNGAALTLPGEVTIAAGQTQATFTMTATDNALRDGSRAVNLNATAATFTAASQGITIRDNEVASYGFGALADIVNVSSPVTVTITALDVEGYAISGFAGTVNLSVVLPGGTTQPLTPATATLAAAGWTGTVTLPAVNSAPLRLRAVDSSGNSGESSAFDIMRVLSLTAADLAWDASRGRIYASVPAAAGGTYANRVVAIDPATLQITGSVTTGQDPGQLALTSGGEYLYAALNANGTIAKINPGSLTVSSTFAVGTSPSYGTLYADDISTVAGQPNLLVVSQYRKSVSPRHNGVAVYDNGVVRPTKTQDHTGSNVIEASADPTIFFGYNTESTEYGFRRLRLDASGMTQLEVSGSLIDGFSVDIRSAGNMVFSNSGVEVDGAQMRRLGTFTLPTGTGPVRPDMAANRVYFIEPQTASSNYDKIGAYDPTTFSLIRRLSFSPAVTLPGGFIRWGTNGLGFKTSNSVVLINSSQLVPSDPPANLRTTIQATPNPASVSAPLTYTVEVTNAGPNTARSVLLGVTLSNSQTIQSVVASSGIAVTAGTTITWPIGDLASAASRTLTITTLPQSAGSLTCTASVNSSSIDPDFSDNTAFKLVSVGFQSTMDSVNTLRLTANNLIYDPARKVLWATIPATVEAPLGRSVVSIDPVTGLVSDPIAINANPMANSIALSGNGRYLYVGLTDSPEVHRIDLTTTPATSVRIALGNSQWGSANYAEDIEVLDGDGTSFLMAGLDDHAAAVFDGAIRRTNRTGIYTVDRVERTGTAGAFVGYNNYSSSFGLTDLSVTAAGVSISRTVSSLVSGYYADIRGAGNLLLSSTGRLVNSSALTLIADLGVIGRPCVDGPYGRAYLVNGNGLRSFDTATALATGTLALPVTSTGDWAQSCVRWGLDGIAILGNDGKIYMARWSQLIPAGIDLNGNGISDAWEAANFGTLQADLQFDPDGDGIASALEYFFGTSPFQSSSSPLQMSLSGSGNNLAASPASIRLVFPRRAGLAVGFYRFESSPDLTNWGLAVGVTQTVLSTETIDGVVIETVEALIPSPDPTSGFVRLIWSNP